MIDQLSIEQECALQQFENGDNLFITGPAGTGKTTLVKEFVTSATRRGKRIQVTAMTGCAAILLGKGSRTIHSWSGIKIDNGTVSAILHRVLKNEKNFANWETCDILHVDEVSMMSQKMFEILDNLGRSIRNRDVPFGGLQVIFTGDFYQLPPIGKVSDIGSDKFCFESPIWHNTFPLDNHIVLNTIFRQNDIAFQSILCGIRTGTLTPEQRELLCKRLGVKYDHSKYHGCSLTRLVPTRKQADTINDNMFSKLDEQCYSFQLIEKRNCVTHLETGQSLRDYELTKCSKLPKKIIDDELTILKANSPCREELHLKKGATVMCLANLELEEGICNGSIGVICAFKNNTPIVKFSNGVVKEIGVKYWQSEEYPTIAVGQLPLCLAWAITIHKSQGCTLPMAEIDIGTSIFECGQTYVGISRVKSLEGVYLSGFNPRRVRVNPKVKQFYDTIPLIQYEYAS
jgi:ATP-dependent DNA helicase PIF1